MRRLLLRHHAADESPLLANLDAPVVRAAGMRGRVVVRVGRLCGRRLVVPLFAWLGMRARRQTDEEREGRPQHQLPEHEDLEVVHASSEGQRKNSYPPSRRRQGRCSTHVFVLVSPISVPARRRHVAGQVQEVDGQALGHAEDALVAIELAVDDPDARRRWRSA